MENVLSSDPLLETMELESGYTSRKVLYGISINVKPGEIVSVLGHNGAGKTTLLKTIFGTITASKGKVCFNNSEITKNNYLQNVISGISFTPAEKNVFADLSVESNLELGGITLKDREVRKNNIERMLKLFPILAKRKKQMAGSMSGGEQRMLSLAIALMPNPKLLLLDEPSLGLAPSTAQDLFSEIAELAKNNSISVILVEQNVKAALRIAHRVYYMRSGSILLEESVEEARGREHWWDLF